MAIRMKLWRPARAGVCYQPDPIHRPGTCTRPKPGVPLPLCCLKPIVIITNASSDATEMLPALPVKPHALDGRYRATVVFAESGSWSIEVNDRHGGIHNLGQVKVGP